jgi:hypothetical protein
MESAGVTSVTSRATAQLTVCWQPATDLVTPADSIVYDVYEAASPGGEVFTRPASYAITGQTCVDLPAPPDQSLCYVVRARDARGNRDLNTVEKCGNAPGVCVDYDTRVQPIFDARCIQCHSGSNPPKGLRWDSYAHAVADSGAVRACRPDNSKLIEQVFGNSMPRDTSSSACSTPAPLTPAEKTFLHDWIAEGAAPNCASTGCP